MEQAFEERLRALARAKRAGRARRSARSTSPCPAREPAPLGHKHPLSIVREEIVDVFRGMGFAVHDGPEVELEENNFTKLGFPPDHPATDMQDSFWTTDGLAPADAHEQHPGSRDETHKPPLAFIAPGRRLPPRRRRDALADVPPDRGFLVDEHVSMAH